MAIQETSRPKGTATEALKTSSDILGIPTKDVRIIINVLDTDGKPSFLEKVAIGAMLRVVARIAGVK